MFLKLQLIAPFLVLLTGLAVVLASKTSKAVSEYKPADQVLRLINSFGKIPVPKFPKNKYPALYDHKQSSFVVEMFRRNFDLSELDEEARRKALHRLRHFDFYKNSAFQLRAILFYPRNTNQYTRKTYLEYARGFLPLFNNYRNWPAIYAALDSVEVVKERLPHIFLSEDERDMKDQYCSYLLVVDLDTRKRLEKLLPALRLGKKYKCEETRDDEDDQLYDFFQLFEEDEDGQKIIGTPTEERSGNESDEDGFDCYAGSPSRLGDEYDEYDECDEYDGLYEDHEQPKSAGITVHLIINKGRFRRDQL